MDFVFKNMLYNWRGCLTTIFIFTSQTIYTLFFNMKADGNILGCNVSWLILYNLITELIDYEDYGVLIILYLVFIWIKTANWTYYICILFLHSFTIIRESIHKIILRSSSAQIYLGYTVPGKFFAQEKHLCPSRTRHRHSSRLRNPTTQFQFYYWAASYLTNKGNESGQHIWGGG